MKKETRNTIGKIETTNILPISGSDISYCHKEKHTDSGKLYVSLIYKAQSPWLSELDTFLATAKVYELYEYESIAGKPEEISCKNFVVRIMAGLVLDGWTFNSIHSLFVSKQTYCMVGKTDSDGMKWLYGAYKHFLVKKLDDDGADLNYAYAVAQKIVWTSSKEIGVRGVSIQKVVLAILAKAFKKHEYITLDAVPVSYSEIQQASRIGKPAISKVLSHLRKSMYINIVEPGTIFNSTVYNIRNLVQYLCSFEISVENSRPGTALETELWNSLGGYARTVYGAVTDVPTSTQEIMAATGISRRTVNNNLKRLQDHGLVKKTGRGEYVRTDLSPATSAERDSALVDSMNKRIQGIDHYRKARRYVLFGRLRHVDSDRAAYLLNKPMNTRG